MSHDEKMTHYVTDRRILKLYEEGSNSNCKHCTDGINNHFFKCVKDKMIISEWSYCQQCFPDSSCIIFGNNDSNFEVIDIFEFNHLDGEGWTDLTGRF